jgi:hypothetical protein
MYVIWAGMVRNTLKKDYNMLMSDQRVINRGDTTYYNIFEPYRDKCNLPELLFHEDQPPDFSGIWFFSEEKSSIDRGGVSNVPYKIYVRQYDNILYLARTIVMEYTDPEVRLDTLILDGTEMKSEFWNSSMVTSAGFSDNNDSILIDSRVTFSRGDRTSEMIIKESWGLSQDGSVLSIEHYSSSPWEERNITTVYTRSLVE